MNQEQEHIRKNEHNDQLPDETNPSQMRTLSEVMNKLKNKGYDNELTFSDHGKMQSSASNKIYNPEDLTIIKTFRFEGISDPADNTALYLTQDKDKEIGYILDIYGTYSDHTAAFDEFLKQIPVNETDTEW